MHTKFWSDDLKGKEHMQDLGTEGKIILQCILEKKCGKVRSEIIWLMTGTSGRLL